MISTQTKIKNQPLKSQGSERKINKIIKTNKINKINFQTEISVKTLTGKDLNELIQKVI